MASDETLALARHYLEKHNTPDSIVGLGPFLETGDYRLLASPRAMLDGSIVLVIDGPGYVDCRTVAQKLYLDILTEHPELGPRIITYGKRIQNFVEITDPVTGEKIQIDSTPWYNCLNPSLSGEDTTEMHAVDVFNFNKATMHIFSVKRTDDSVTTTGIIGFLPQVSIEEKLAELDRMKNYIHTEESKVEYRFIFQVESRPVDWPAGKPSPRFAHFYVNVLDSQALQNLGFIKDLDTLIKLGVIEIGVAPEGINIPTPSIAFMKELVERMKDADLFEEFERNIPRILKLLGLAKPTLMVDGRSNQVIDVKRGLFLRSLLPELSIIESIKPGLDYLGSDWKDKYGDALAAFGRDLLSRTKIPKNDLGGIKLKPIKIKVA